MYIIQYNKYCFYTGIISGIDTSHKIYKLLTGLVSIAVCIHLIICIIVNTKCIENSFYFLCFFYLGLCRTPWWTAICLFAAIGPFSSWYNSMESGGVLYLNSSILFFLIRIQDLCFYPIPSLNSSTLYHVLPGHSLSQYDWYSLPTSFLPLCILQVHVTTM